MTIKLKRVYEKPAKEDGYRVLVDRLWPRGVTKDAAKVDEWLKQAAPTDELRKWIHADIEGRWEEFRERYLKELEPRREELRPLAKRAKSEVVTLLFGAKDEEHNNAVVLRDFLKKLR